MRDLNTRLVDLADQGFNILGELNENQVHGDGGLSRFYTIYFTRRIRRYADILNFNNLNEYISG